MKLSQSACLTLALILCAGSASNALAGDVTLIHSHDLWNYGGNWSGGVVPAYPDNIYIPANMDSQLTDVRNANVLDNSGIIFLANPAAQLASFAPSNLGTIWFYVGGSVYSSFDNSHVSAILVNNNVSSRFRVMNASSMDTTFHGYSKIMGGHLTMQGDGHSQFTHTHYSTFDITGELTLDSLRFTNAYDGTIRMISPAVISSVNPTITLTSYGALTASTGPGGGSCSMSPNVAFLNNGSVRCSSGVLHIQNCASVVGTTLASGNWLLEGTGQTYLNNLENLSAIGQGAIVQFNGDSTDMVQVHAVSEIAGGLFLTARSFESTPPGGTVYNEGRVQIGHDSRFRAHSSFLSLAGSTLSIEVNAPGDNGLVICDDVAAIYGAVELAFHGAYRPTCGDRIQIMTGQRLYDLHTAIYTAGWQPPSGMQMTIEQRFGALEVLFSPIADFNGDGSIDFFDYLDFVAAFSNGDENADFNRDGGIDFFDYLDFVNAFSVGC